MPYPVYLYLHVLSMTDRRSQTVSAGAASWVSTLFQQLHSFSLTAGCMWFPAAAWAVRMWPVCAFDWGSFTLMRCSCWTVCSGTSICFDSCSITSAFRRLLVPTGTLKEQNLKHCNTSQFTAQDLQLTSNVITLELISMNAVPEVLDQIISGLPLNLSYQI